MTTQTMVCPPGFVECNVNGNRYVPTPGAVTVSIPLPALNTDLAYRTANDDIATLVSIYGTLLPNPNVVVGFCTMQFPAPPSGNTVTVNGHTYQINRAPGTIQAALSDVLALQKLGFV